MTAWIGALSADHIDNWEICKQTRLWGTPSPSGRNVQAGDSLYIWQSKAGWLAECRATTDAYAPQTTREVPWAAPERYKYLFGIEVVVENSDPVWMSADELRQELGMPSIRLGQFPALDSTVEARLRAWLIEESVTEDIEKQRESIASEVDARRFVERAIVARQGQQDFRKQLLRTWGARCAVTGCDAEPALEAAHVRPYLGPQTSSLGNGLPLRADIHTLFDRLLITIDPDTWTVRLCPLLQLTSYADLDGVPVSVPSGVPTDELAQGLATHRDQVLGPPEG